MVMSKRVDRDTMYRGVRLIDEFIARDDCSVRVASQLTLLIANGFIG